MSWRDGVFFSLGLCFTALVLVDGATQHAPTGQLVVEGVLGGVGSLGIWVRRRWLSTREREVAEAVGQGKSNLEISGELFMSVATEKAHVSRILTKLDLNNRTQIALLAHDAGLS